MFGVLIFTSMQINAPGVPCWSNAMTTTLNIYSQVGLVTLIHLIAKDCQGQPNPLPHKKLKNIEI
tara:strand:+ start:8535 stop:8729 length:195 start_codon:yes stop_codon:yes gene_type:complete